MLLFCKRRNAAVSPDTYDPATKPLSAYLPCWNRNRQSAPPKYASRTSADCSALFPAKSRLVPVNETPESLFMRQWAAALVAHVLQRLRLFYEEQGQPRWYEVFSATHALADLSERVTQEALGSRFGLTRDQVRYALDMTQKRFVHFLREEVRDQVGSEAEVDNEVRELLALLGS